MNWLKKNWLSLLLTLILIIPIIFMIFHIRISINSNGILSFHTIHNGYGNGGKNLLTHVSGEFAIRLFVFCLTITPISIIFGLKKVIKYKKLFGIYTFIYSLMHFFFFITSRGFSSLSQNIGFIIGTTSFVILLFLCITSNKWSIKFLGKKWKILQKFAYLSGCLCVTHLVFLGNEIWIVYGIILIAGYIIRIPKIKEKFVNLHRFKTVW